MNYCKKCEVNLYGDNEDLDIVCGNCAGEGPYEIDKYDEAIEKELCHKKEENEK